MNDFNVTTCFYHHGLNIEYSTFGPWSYSDSELFKNTSLFNIKTNRKMLKTIFPLKLVIFSLNFCNEKKLIFSQ